MEGLKHDTLTLDLNSECSERVNKAWATDLTSQITVAFEKISSFINTMNNSFQIFAEKFDNLESSLRNDIVVVKKTANSAIALSKENKSSIEQLQQEIADLKRDHKLEIDTLKQNQVTQQFETETLEVDYREVKTEYSAIKTQTNNIETYSRRDNLIFHGITEPTNESGISCAKSVRKFMVDNLQISENAAAAVQFVRCHRINDSYRASTCKPVIVRFKNFSDRKLIWSKKSVITNRNCNLSEDFPREIAYKRRKLFPVFSKARRIPGINKNSVSLKADILIINGKRYTVDMLDQLKNDLDMKTFNERSNDSRIVFGGMYSNFHPLSNYYACPITFRKQKYRSLEQAYQHCKSTFFGQAESASRIMASRDPAEAKRISYDVSGPRDLQNKWDAQRVDLMTSLVRAKYDQNPLVLRELQSTGTKIMGESGKDRFYGTGLSITHSDILNGTKWTGKSTLGEILMNIRREKNQDT